MNAPNPLVARVGAPPIAESGRWAAAYDGRLGPLIDCSQAVPNHAPPAELAARLAEAAASPLAARYGPILGDDALRTAYAGHVSAIYGAALGADDIAITSGCNQAFFAAMIAIAKAGEAIVLPAPWYFNHKMTLDMLGIEARIVPARAESGFLPSLEDIDAAIDGKVRAVVLVSPNNPTGAVYPDRLLRQIFDHCADRGIRLVLDETYRDFVAEAGAPPHGLFRDRRWGDHLVSLYSFSKSYAIPGHRVGALAAGPMLIRQVEKIIDCIQICAPRPAQAALAWAIEGLAGWRREASREIFARAEVFRDVVAGLDGWRLEGIGAYFAYLRHPFPDVPAERVAALVARELGILALPGSFFGPGQERHLRVAFANVPGPGIRELAARLARGTEGLADRMEPASHARTGHG